MRKFLIEKRVLFLNNNQFFIPLAYIDFWKIQFLLLTLSNELNSVYGFGLFVHLSLCLSLCSHSNLSKYSRIFVQLTYVNVFHTVFGIENELGSVYSLFTVILKTIMVHYCQWGEIVRSVYKWHYTTSNELKVM